MKKGITKVLITIASISAFNSVSAGIPVIDLGSSVVVTESEILLQDGFTTTLNSKDCQYSATVKETVSTNHILIINNMLCGSLVKSLTGKSILLESKIPEGAEIKIPVGFSDKALMFSEVLKNEEKLN